MRIYMDESGNFTPSQLISLVLVLVVPSTYESNLFSEFSLLTAGWQKENGEVKGSSLDERKAAEIIALVSRFDVIADFYCIDVAAHTLVEIEDFKTRQADALVAGLPPSIHPDMLKQLSDTAGAIRRLSNQLFVQAWLTIDLVLEIVEAATMYYSQRLPKELGDIAWIIDAKDHTLTEMEDIWSLLVVPFAENHFAKRNFKMLVEGDYSEFDRRYKSKNDSELMAHRKWLETQIPISAQARVNPVTDAKLLLTEQLEFENSKNRIGLQLADMLANILRRAWNNKLPRAGWDDFGKLIIEKPWKYNTWFERIGDSQNYMKPSNHIATVIEVLESKAKPMRFQR